MLKPCVCGFGHAHFSGHFTGVREAHGKDLRSKKRADRSPGMDFFAGEREKAAVPRQAQAAEGAVAGKLRQEDA